MINKISSEVFQLHFKIFGSCVYLLKLEEGNILIDTSTKENGEELLENLEELNIKPEDIDLIILTHDHWDHTGNLKLFLDAEGYSAENIDKLAIKGLEVIKTPGHSKDSLCFLYKDILFSGDTIFHDGGRGRTDLPGGNETEIQESIKKLKSIDYRILCPGHID